jgi:hypothetical protein
MSERPNVIIYVLCYNEKTLEIAKDIYKDYYWARPCIIENQDITLENAFWKQLLAMSDEWELCEMVGTISWKAYKKINIQKKVDEIIKSRDLWKLATIIFTGQI